MFRALQQAAPSTELGIMVMYLGAEKAGIPLDSFRGTPFRVGEFMFSDDAFGSVKGKTDELFSALFHRRFTSPELAYSETTAFPADQLSARNLAAKLTVSLIADVRNTMFMSGLRPFAPKSWETLGPAMRQSAQLHEKIAAHQPRGPFKHFWGWDARRVGDDRPFSLFLASGIPFEVVEELPTDGWTFLCDADARAVAAGRLRSRGRRLVVRPESAARGPDLMPVAEDLGAMFELKRRVVPSLRGVPYLEGEHPAVFTWYPTARCGLVWNLEDTPRAFEVNQEGSALQTVQVEPLGVALVAGLQPRQAG